MRLRSITVPRSIPPTPGSIDRSFNDGAYSVEWNQLFEDGVTLGRRAVIVLWLGIMGKLMSELDVRSLSGLQVDIAKMILDGIASGRWKAGAHISDFKLAQELGTSRTPVRNVLQLLEKHGLLERRHQQGFHFHNIDPVRFDAFRRELPGSSNEQLLEEIMMARANGAIADEASEAELASQFGASRGAVRKALLRLAADGLAERRPGHGWRCAERLDNGQAVDESYAFRVIIECAAVKEPGFRIDRTAFAALRAEQEMLRDAPPATIVRSEWFEANARFHATVVSWSGNRFLQQAIHRQNSLRRMTEYAEFTTLAPDRIRKAAEDHLAILDAIDTGDNDRAAAILHRHLSRSQHA